MLLDSSVQRRQVAFRTVSEKALTSDIAEAHIGNGVSNIELPSDRSNDARHRDDEHTDQ
ncbi:MAG TPA: hypothetical protein VLU91_00920 [Nitrososphaerales archaeon]|nr:hypothetical protein [Nitrososphaerales archaeon]